MGQTINFFGFTFLDKVTHKPKILFFVLETILGYLKIIILECQGYWRVELMSPTYFYNEQTFSNSFNQKVSIIW